MIFRTELHPGVAEHKLDLTSKVVTVGSCFSEVIGRQLEKYKIQTLSNPFGTIFNPLSACKLLQVCAGADVELADSFVENNGRWYSYDFHSSFSAPTEEELYEQLDEVIVKTRRFLKQTDTLVLTLGTANIFRLKITGETVANCHKLPAANFTRETLLPEEIITAIAETHSLLRDLNPNLRLVLTVSPVRHLKDTLELNSVSKAVLRLATHYLSQQLPFISYFPAYELLIDDLRDYRFYKEDMLHPTATAEQYIWEKFSGAYFEETFHLFAQEWEKVLKAREHRPFHPESPGHQAFLQHIIGLLDSLKEKVDVTEELAYFESQVVVLPEVVEEPDSEEDEEEIPETTENITKTAQEAEEPEAEEAGAPVMTAIPAESLAALEEGNRKKKKRKPKRKKKKPFGAEGTTPLAEAAAETILAAEQSETDASSEFAPEIGDLLETTAEPIVATLAAAFTEPAGATLSKSAKKRANRRKKKALAAQHSATEETLSAPASNPVQERTSIQPEQEISDLLPRSGTQTTTPELATLPDAGSVSAEAEPGPSEENLPAPALKGRRERQPAKTSSRSKKRVFPELFAPVVPAEMSSEEAPELPEQPETALEVNPLLEILPDMENIPAPVVPKRRGRAKKAEPLTAAETPLAALPETSRPIQPEAALPVPPEPVVISGADTPEPTNTMAEPAKKKRAYNRKPKPEAPKEIVPSPAPKGRRKKATPDA